MNSTWNATHAVQLKQDYLISDRDMDAYRYAMSHDMINGKPRPKVLMSNPHNKKQRILYAEPFPSRNKWAPIIANQEEQFGLIRSEGTDCTERNFPSVLQALVDRDAHQLANPDSYTSGTKKLKAVIGFDGADNFCHVLLGLIEYKEGVACESEIKRVALAVMMGDDHNPSLQNILLLATWPRHRAVHQGGSNSHALRPRHTGGDHHLPRPLSIVQYDGAPLQRFPPHPLYRPPPDHRVWRR